MLVNHFHVFFWKNIAIIDCFLLGSAGALGTLGMLLTVEAFRFGEVSSLAPYPYSRIIFATLAGYFVFNEFISANEIIGAIIIIFCTFLAVEKEKN